MPRGFLVLAASAAAALATISPVVAKDTVIAHRTSPKGAQAVYLAKGLTPGRKYRIDVVAGKHVKISGLVLENYVYIHNKQMGTGTKTLKLSGTTPQSLKLNQPVSYSLSSWDVVVQVADSSHVRLTTRIVDIGKR